MAADLSYFLFGFSVWWCVAAAGRVWLSLLADRLRGESTLEAAPAQPGKLRRWIFWGGLAFLMYSSTTLEWARLYRLELMLPGASGGALGQLLGPWSVRWMGFAGSGLVSIVVGLVGVSMVFNFSWPRVAERLGAFLYSLVESRREKKEAAQDRELGQLAVREREEVFLEEHGEATVVHQPVAPVVIEPVMVELPPSARVAKERQNPCSVKCPTASCHKWPCWTIPNCDRKRYRRKRWK